jgi:hypothetical protein
MKQSKAYETKFKQPQNGVRLNMKSTPRSKRNKTWGKNKRERHLQRQNNLTSLKNKVSKRVSTLDMP